MLEIFNSINCQWSENNSDYILKISVDSNRLTLPCSSVKVFSEKKYICIIYVFTDKKTLDSLQREPGIYLSSLVLPACFTR